jgi:hypothetical protein
MNNKKLIERFLQEATGNLETRARMRKSLEANCKHVEQSVADWCVMHFEDAEIDEDVNKIFFPEGTYVFFGAISGHGVGFLRWLQGGRV